MNRRYFEAAKLRAQQDATAATAKRTALITSAVNVVLMASTVGTHAGIDQTVYADAYSAALGVADLDAIIVRASAEVAACDALLAAFDAALA